MAELDKLGEENLEDPNLYEKNFLFLKTYDCPVCETTFKNATVKANRARLIRTDQDLRPVHDGVEPLKYEAIVCPKCGYAALNRYFGILAPSQAKAVREKISGSYRGSSSQKETYTLQEALDRNKLCLVNAMVKRAKPSEKAYICLKCAWLVRCMEEELSKDASENSEELKTLKDQERQYLQSAYDGFVDARMTEGNYPMCGMDEMTVDYLVAVLAMDVEQYEVAAKMISTILTSSSATSRIKDKSRSLKEELIRLLKEKKA